MTHKNRPRQTKSILRAKNNSSPQPHISKTRGALAELGFLEVTPPAWLGWFLCRKGTLHMLRDTLPYGGSPPLSQGSLGTSAGLQGLVVA